MTEHKLALLDVDGTLTPVRSIWQYVLERTNTWSGAGEDNLRRYIDGVISYEEFCHLDAALLKGMRYEELIRIAAEVPMNNGAPELVALLGRLEYTTVLISTGLRILTSTLGARMRIDDCVVNDLEVMNGICTGRAVLNIHENDKGIHARRLMESYQSAYTLAIGDGLGDIPMFHEADYSIAVGSPADEVIAAADYYHPSLDLSGLRHIVEQLEERWDINEASAS